MQKNFIDFLIDIKNKFQSELDLVSTQQELLELRQRYCRKDGLLAEITDQFKVLSQEEKKNIGSELVGIKKYVNDLLSKKEEAIFLKKVNFPDPIIFDPSLEKNIIHDGVLHPYTETISFVSDFFSSIGFEILKSNILTTEYENFTSLNIPEGHSARDEHDTFWIDERRLLRTHTSNVQVKEACKREYPFAFVSVGTVYRNEASDASHDFMFLQLEAMYFAEDATLGSLLYVMKNFLNFYFDKKNLDVRARPGVFPFVEPGLEIDFQCPFCKIGCSVCKHSTWIEVGGAGMVHRFVKNEMGLSENHKGWAFGFGLTRLVMLKYKINDIRKLHQSLLGIG
jgi:phenylalanyl-tRNA synthetase alpha chain